MIEINIRRNISYNIITIESQGVHHKAFNTQYEEAPLIMLPVCEAYQTQQGNISDMIKNNKQKYFFWRS